MLDAHLTCHGRWSWSAAFALTTAWLLTTPGDAIGQDPFAAIHGTRAPVRAGDSIKVGTNVFDGLPGSSYIAEFEDANGINTVPLVAGRPEVINLQAGGVGTSMRVSVFEDGMKIGEEFIDVLDNGVVEITRLTFGDFPSQATAIRAEAPGLTLPLSLNNLIEFEDSTFVPGVGEVITDKDAVTAMGGFIGIFALQDIDGEHAGYQTDISGLTQTLDPFLPGILPEAYLEITQDPAVPPFGLMKTYEQSNIAVFYGDLGVIANFERPANGAAVSPASTLEPIMIPISYQATLDLDPESDTFGRFEAIVRSGFAVPGMKVPGDADGDGDVDAFDLGLWQTQFGMTGEGLSADFDMDNDVDAFDLGIWQINFGTGVEAAIPEPATLVMLLAAAVVRRRRRTFA